MNDDDIIAIIRQYLADISTSNYPSIGADWGYDDYGLQNTIGGIGAVDSGLYPYEDWAMTGIGDTFNPAGQPYGSNAIGGDGMYLGVPRAVPYGPTTPVYSPEMAALQYGLDQRQAAPKEMRPFWQPSRTYGDYSAIQHPASVPLVRSTYAPVLGAGPVRVTKMEESRKDTSKRRPAPANDARNTSQRAYVDTRNPAAYQPSSAAIQILTALPAQRTDTASNLGGTQSRANAMRKLTR